MSNFGKVNLLKTKSRNFVEDEGANLCQYIVLPCMSERACVCVCVCVRVRERPSAVVENTHIATDSPDEDGVDAVLLSDHHVVEAVEGHALVCVIELIRAQEDYDVMHQALVPRG